eukprot:g2393.t1
MQSKTYHLRNREELSPEERKSNRKFLCDGLKLLSAAARIVKEEQTNIDRASSSPATKAVSKRRVKTGVSIKTSTSPMKTPGKHGHQRDANPVSKRRRKETNTNQKRPISTQQLTPSKSKARSQTRKDLTWREIIWKDLGVDVNSSQSMDWRELLRKHGVPVEELEVFL